MAEASNKYGYPIKYDISMPAEQYYEVVDKLYEFIQESPRFSDEEKKVIQVCGYG